jgi:beta-phosphoglucomutase-like phosphatase (HAD superfamily)
MAHLKAVLWDVDGTLADTELDGHRVAFNQAFAEADLPWDWTPELYGHLLQVTGGKERIRFFIEQYFPLLEPPEGLEAFITHLHKRKTHFYLSLLGSGGIPLRPGVQRLIQAIRNSGLKQAIVTTTTPDNVTALIRSTLGESALQWFDCIAAGDIVPHKKPAPDVYLDAVQQLKLTAEDCLAIEDSENGYQAALAANIPVLITVNEYTQAQTFPKAVAVLDHLGEPDQAFRMLQGHAGQATYVTVELLNNLV